MSNYFNDSPIELPEEDQYGITPFADALAKCILQVQNPIGTTIALNGPWGSGKSSAINLIRAKLSNVPDTTLVVTDFKCWWYRGEEALALAFLQNLNSVFRDKLGDRVRNLVPKIGKALLQAGPVIGPTVALASTGGWGALASGSTSFLKKYFPDGDTLEQTFRNLAKELEGEARRFLVIIDDIDRLNPDEALAIFRLVKSVGRLPNVMYLLVFDRQLADKAVAEKYPSEGAHFLEKIIQAGFEIPLPLQSDLNAATLASIEKICGQPDEEEITRIMNIFYDVVAPYIVTPRHVARFGNAISITWPAVASNVSIADFVGMEILRLYEPKLFHNIRTNKDRVCGVRQRNELEEARFEIFLKGVPPERQENAKIALQRLFPRLEGINYGSDFISEWDAERRVCVEKHFDTYFRLSLGEDVLPAERVAELIAHASDREFVQSSMKEACAVIRKNGMSMVPVFLDELIVRASRVETEKVGPLITSLFQIHDEIDREADGDRGFSRVATTSLRYHWLIRRLTEDRFSIGERTEIYLSAAEAASLGWLVDFTASAKGDYHNREGKPRREEMCLVTEDALPRLIELALGKIRESSEDRSLLEHPDLLYILYRWRDFVGDVSEVKSWTDQLLADDEALVILARQFTSESWSLAMGFDGLGDRVSRRQVAVHIKEDTNIIDVKTFRDGLERIRNERRLDAESLDVVDVFLDAWDKKGDD